jgi:hypothetical protein
MNRLAKFVEKGAYGEGPGRTAYVMDETDLPAALDGMEWRQIDTFNASDELSKHPGLKEVFRVAIDEGCAVIAAPATRDPLN